MSEIPRFDIAYTSMVENVNGDYVIYNDHLAEVQRLEADLRIAARAQQPSPAQDKEQP